MLSRIFYINNTRHGGEHSLGEGSRSALSRLWHSVPGFVSVLFFLLLTVSLPAQNRRVRRGNTTFNQAVEFKRDSVVMTDSLRAVRDSIHRADSLFRIDSLALQKQS